MGIAGIALITFVVSFFQGIKSIVEFLIWRKKTKVFGTIKNLIDTKIHYENEKKKKIIGIEYVYSFDVCVGETMYNLEYIETVPGDKPNKLQTGDSVEVYFDEKKRFFKEVALVKSNLWGFPLAMLISAVVFILSIIILVWIN